MNADTNIEKPRLGAKPEPKYLRLRRKLSATSDAPKDVNIRDEYLGALPIIKLLSARPRGTVGEITSNEETPIHAPESET